MSELIARATRPDSRRGLGVLTLGLAVTVCVVVFSGALRAVLERGGEPVEAVFASTARLPKGSPVRIHGVEVGHVSGMTLDADGRSSTVRMTLDEGVLPLYRNAAARLTWRTLLGGNYAIELDRGSPSAGVLSSGRIPRSRTTAQVEVDEFLSALRDRERAGLQTMLSELPAALADHRAPQRALAALADGAPAIARGVAAVRGRRSGDLRALVANAARTVGALDTTGTTLHDVVEGGGVVTGVMARRAGDVKATITEAAGVMPEIRATIPRLRATLRMTDPVLTALRAASPEVAPSLARLRPAVTQADALLQDARPLLGRLQPAAVALAAASREGRPLVDELGPILDRAGDTILPDLAKKDPVTKRATYEMVGSTVAALQAAAGAYDGVSHLLALTPGLGERALDTLPCTTYFGDPASPKVIACQSLGDVFATLLGNPPTRKGPAR